MDGEGRSVTFHHAAVGACHVVTCHVGTCHVGACHVGTCHVGACRVEACRVGACHVGACRVEACRVGALSFSNPRVSPVACVGHVGLGWGGGGVFTCAYVGVCT